VATWKYIITNYDGSNPAEVTNVYDRKVIDPLNRMPTASGRVRTDHQLIDRLSTGDAMLKAYRTNLAGVYQLRFLGPIITAEESADADGNSMQFNASGGFYYIQNRLIGKGDKGQPYIYGTPTTDATRPLRTGLKQRSAIAADILATINADGYTGITLGSNPVMPADAHYGPVTFSSAGEAILELCAGNAVGGYDWQVTPVDFGAAPAGAVAIGGVTPKQIGTFNMYYSQKGSTLNNVVFEFGTSRQQVTSYKCTASKDALLTYGYILPPGYPTSNTPGSTPLSSSNAAGLTARGLIEAVVPSENPSAKIRQSLIDKHVAMRSGYRYLVTWTLAKNATPSAFDAYNTGDFIRARAVYNGIVRFDQFFRVWGITANIDNEGNEQIELELQEPQ
jgi:hypothetical protein